MTDRLQKARDYSRERLAASFTTNERIASLRDDRDAGTLGDEVIKMAQALILCTLPYRPTVARQTMRTARLSDGSILRVTFTAGIDGVAMPYGADRHLMAWLFDRAISTDSPFVPLHSASAYLRESGRSINGKRIADLTERLNRLSGLVIGIERRSAQDTRTVMLPMIASSRLPVHLTPHLEAERAGQQSLPGLAERFGIQLEERFFADIRKHHVAIPRRLWMELQAQNGGPQLQDLLTFFVYRCYCAQSDTVIPWAGLRDQFPQDDSNPRRFKVMVKRAVALLRTLWPEARLTVVPGGVEVTRPSAPLLEDDTERKRVRRIGS